MEEENNVHIVSSYVFPIYGVNQYDFQVVQISTSKFSFFYSR